VGAARPGGAALERALWIGLAVLVAARALAPALPGMWLWSLNLQRFLPWWGWALWALSALALAPPLARRLHPWLERAGDALARGLPWSAAAMAAGGLLVFALPDQVRFVGDFLLRQGTVEESASPGVLFPQALPLDVVLHYSLPLWMGRALFLDANLSSRLLGALDAAVLAGLALAFARRLQLKGAALAAAAGVVWWGAWLGLFTGFSKAFAEMTLLVVAVAALGLDTLRTGRRPLVLGLVVYAGLFLHRSALALLPAAGLAFALAARAPAAETSPAGEPKPRRRRAAEARGRAAARAAGPSAAPRWRLALGAALPVVAVLLLAPKLVATVRAFDAAHFMAPGENARTSFEELLAPLRLLDEANLLVLLVPLVPLLPLLLALRRPGRLLAPREWAFLALLAVPFAAVALVLRPAQGLFRDFDDFAAGGVGLALLLAAAVGEWLRSASRAAWLALAVLLGSAVPAAQWVAHQTDLARGLARIEALAAGPPRRSAEERAKTWDYLGVRSYRTGRLADAARYLEHAAELAPSPRIVLEWAMAAGNAGDWAMAERAYHRLLERTPTTPDFQPYRVSALVGLAGTLAQRDALPEARAYAEQALRLSPGHPAASAVKSFVDQETARRLRGDTTHFRIEPVRPPGP
jgi:tetratricopeptide (TPR) repeat protein